jgi:hypothetical protein
MPCVCQKCGRPIDCGDDLCPYCEDDGCVACDYKVESKPNRKGIIHASAIR